MEHAFGLGAGSGDAAEGFVFRKQRIDTFDGGELGFQAVGSLNVPSG